MTHTIKHVIIGAHEVPFTVDRSINTYFGTLHDVNIVISGAGYAQATPFYNLTLTYADQVVTRHEVNGLTLGGVISVIVADMRHLSPYDAYAQGLMVRFYADASHTYQIHAGYVRAYFTADRTLYCYECADDVECFSNWVMRSRRRDDEPHSIEASVHAGAYAAFIPTCLMMLLSYIKKVEQS